MFIDAYRPMLSPSFVTLFVYIYSQMKKARSAEREQAFIKPVRQDQTITSVSHRRHTSASKIITSQ